ncbi:hypothetical protein [Niallia sp. 01092]|uniref:hypothetical protein n=1 Tax=unclassified Niallia TaxID=2837522 RepID=UPI003FD43314
MQRDIERFGNAFPNGVFAFPPSSEAPKVKIRALGEYCKAKGIEPNDLSPKEMEQFLYFE